LAFLDDHSFSSFLDSLMASCIAFEKFTLMSLPFPPAVLRVRLLLLGLLVCLLLVHLGLPLVLLFKVVLVEVVLVEVVLVEVVLPGSFLEVVLVEAVLPGYSLCYFLDHKRCVLRQRLGEVLGFLESHGFLSGP
jgi:hypothetical protein